MERLNSLLFVSNCLYPTGPNYRSFPACMTIQLRVTSLRSQIH